MGFFFLNNAPQLHLERGYSKLTYLTAKAVPEGGIDWEGNNGFRIITASHGRTWHFRLICSIAKCSITTC